MPNLVSLLNLLKTDFVSLLASLGLGKRQRRDLAEKKEEEKRDAIAAVWSFAMEQASKQTHREVREATWKANRDNKDREAKLRAEYNRLQAETAAVTYQAGFYKDYAILRDGEQQLTVFLKDFFARNPETALLFDDRQSKSACLMAKILLERSEILLRSVAKAGKPLGLLAAAPSAQPDGNNGSESKEKAN